MSKNNFTIHHIGRVVKSIREELEFYRSLGFGCDKKIKRDKFQRVKVGLVDLGKGVFLELLEPWGKKSPIINFLKKGGGLHHICYEVGDLEKKRSEIRPCGVVLGKPTPSVFNKSRIFFFYSQKNELIEFIEKRKKR